MGTLEQNKNVAREFIDAMAKQDVDRFCATLTRDAVIETIGSMAVSARKNAAHVAKELGVLRRVFPDGMVLKIVTITAEDNRVLCELQGLNTTIDGKRYDNRYIFLFEFTGDKISEVREYQDTALVERVLMPTFRSLGVVANPGGE